MPDIQTAAEAAPAVPPPPMHPMHPRRGESLSPMFTAFLCWLLRLDPITDPAITNIAVAGDMVLAATTANPFFDAHLGSIEDFERNLRGWSDACGADASTFDGLVARMRGTG